MTKNIDYMMELVTDYLSGKTPRYIFELDFQTEILARYKKMERENRDHAEVFYELISESGVDIGDDLSDVDFNELIQRQYDTVEDIYSEGIY
ncbi:MAG: hypothetical protein J7L77_01795 [Clostridiales bacterium]|nr:hypothetical protein [Clostridiales bacterium]